MDDALFCVAFQALGRELYRIQRHTTSNPGRRLFCCHASSFVPSRTLFKALPRRPIWDDGFFFARFKLYAVTQAVWRSSLTSHLCRIYHQRHPRNSSRHAYIVPQHAEVHRSSNAVFGAQPTDPVQHARSVSSLASVVSGPNLHFFHKTQGSISIQSYIAPTSAVRMKYCTRLLTTLSDLPGCSF